MFVLLQPKRPRAVKSRDGGERMSSAQGGTIQQKRQTSNEVHAPRYNVAGSSERQLLGSAISTFSGQAFDGMRKAT